MQKGWFGWELPLNIRMMMLERCGRRCKINKFGLESLKYPTIFTESVPSGAPAATDFKYIFINPHDRFFSDINVDSNSGLTFVFLHEIAHNIFDHKTRGEGKDPHLWIYATDYFINLFLWNLEKENKDWDEQANLIIMKMDNYTDKILFNRKFDSMIEEEIYEKLQSDGQFKKKEEEISYKDFLDDVGLPSDGISKDSKIKITKTELNFDGKVEKKTFVEFPKGEEIPDGNSDKKLDTALSKTMFESRITNKGFQSQEFAGFIKRIFKTKIPWDVILRDSILIDLQKKGDITYSKPRLIWLANTSLPYLPNIQEEEVYGTLVLLIDESGSMCDEDIAHAVEVAQQADSYYKNVFVIKHDTVVKWSKLYEDKLTKNDIDELLIRKSHGGTSHSDAFQKVLDFEKEHNTFVSLVLSLTDMCSDIKIAQKILPSRIPRIYLKVLDYPTDGILGKIIELK
jgi:predicted metal-dependent peptidase